MPETRASLSSLGQWREQYAAATASLNLRRSRELVQAAADAGAGLSALYVDVVRPGLERVLKQPLAPRLERLLAESAGAALNDVAARPVDGATMHGNGRHALVSVGDAPLDALDGQVIVDALAADGWTVGEIAATAPAQDVADQSAASGVQLVVMPTSNPADLLLAAAAYTLLHALDDPPLIVACSFGRPEDDVRGRAAGADVFVDTPAALLDFVAEQFAGGHRRARARRFRPRADAGA